MLNKTYSNESDEQWREKFPSTLSKLFSFYQCLCTIAILGCEIGSILIDLFNATIYVGIWASIFFTIASVLQAVSVSYRFTRQYATYTLIFQCIALFFTICVMGFDAYFIIDPTTCFFSSSLCNSAAPVRGVFYSTDHFSEIKIPLIKGQLAIAAIMFAFCIDYIIMYTVISIHLKNKTKISQQITRNPVVSINNENPRIDSSVNPSERILSTSLDMTFNSPSTRCVHQSRWSIDSFHLKPVKE